MLAFRKLTIVMLSLLIFAGCEMTPKNDVVSITNEVVKRPFDEWPAFYKQLEKKGRITPEKCKEMTDAWVFMKKAREDGEIARAKEEKKLLAEREKEHKRLASERKRMWDSLTPAQKMDFELRQQQLAQQQANMAYQAEAQRRANVAAALSNFQQGLQNQEMINAYDRRTRVMSQPVDVNVNGNINHNFNGGYVQPYSKPWYYY